MKRIRIDQTGEPEVMRLEEAQAPSPGPGQVLVRIQAAGVNPVDTYVRAGSYGYSPQVPYTPGADGAGVVEAVGPGVTKVRVGDRVYGGRSVSGSYAEQAIFDEIQVYPLPDNSTFAQGACLGIPYGTACRALLQKARVKLGETVLIHGASGGVGSAAVQVAKAEGVTVIGTAGSEEGKRLAKEQGADPLLDHRDLGHFDEVMRITKGAGVNLILEMLANQNLANDLKILAPFGRVVVIGSRGAIEIDPREAMQRDASILGMVLKNTPPRELQQIHAYIGVGLQQGTLRPVVGREFPLAQAPQAHRAVMTPPAYGNIVLIP